jgi:hypothetical protein
VPIPDYIYPAIGVIHMVDDAIRAYDDFTEAGQTKLGNDSAQLRKLGQAFGTADEQSTENDGTVWRIQRNIANDIAKVLSR